MRTIARCMWLATAVIAAGIAALGLYASSHAKRAAPVEKWYELNPAPSPDEAVRTLYSVESWQPTFTFGGGTPQEFVAVFRIGGEAPANDGFVIWREGENAFVRRGYGGLSTPGRPLKRVISVSSGEPVSTEVCYEFLSLRRMLDRLPRGTDRTPVTMHDGMEYYVYYRQGSSEWKYGLWGDPGSEEAELRIRLLGAALWPVPKPYYDDRGWPVIDK